MAHEQLGQSVAMLGEHRDTQMHCDLNASSAAIDLIVSSADRRIPCSSPMTMRPAATIRHTGMGGERRPATPTTLAAPTTPMAPPTTTSTTECLSSVSRDWPMIAAIEVRTATAQGRAKRDRCASLW